MTLPVHGFVLAGGKSSRMGRDKALMELRGHPMVEIAVEKLRTFCAGVAIAGNREDLKRFAPVIAETRMDIGPAAGIEAGLRAAEQPWVMFVPVDVPLVPGEMLRRWAEDVLAQAANGLASAYLIVNGVRQPAFCMFRSDRLGRVTEAIDAGKRRLNELVDAAGEADDGFCVGVDAAAFAPQGETGDEVERWFTNVNVPEDMALVEAWVLGCENSGGGAK